jgi:Ca2+-dependent lipid-binding protein
MSKLFVSIFSATGLIRTDIVANSDPYVKLSFQNQFLKTNVIKDSLKPVWNESLF